MKAKNMILLSSSVNVFGQNALAYSFCENSLDIMPL